MAEPVRARRLSSGTPVAAIARLVAADEGTVRDMIHAFNAKGLSALDPHWAGGRPPLISDADIAFIVTTATTRPNKLGLPFTRWSIRKLASYLAGTYQQVEPGRGLQRVPARKIQIGRERLRQVLSDHDITFQRTRTWKQSTDPDFEAKLDRIEHLTSWFADRCFAALANDPAHPLMARVRPRSPDHQRAFAPLRPTGPSSRVRLVPFRAHDR